MSNTPQQYEEREVTFLDALKVCFRYKYLVIAVTLIVTILGTLFIQLIYNASNRYYYSYFALYYTDVPAVVNTDVDFNFTSDAVVNSLKQNEELEGIDFEKLVGANMGLAFDTSLSTDEERIHYANFPYNRDAVYYVWSADYNTIDDEEQAVALVNALTENAIELTREKISALKFDSYLNQATDAESFLSEINYLQNQASMIVSNYETLISKYGANLYVTGNETLKNKVDEIKIYISKVGFEDIRDRIDRNSYVKYLPVLDDEGNIVNYQADDRYKVSVRESIKANTEQLKEIEPLYAEAKQKTENPGSNSDLNNYWANRYEALSTQIIELTRKNNRLAECETKMNKTTVTTQDECYAETAEIRQDLADCYNYFESVLEEYKQDLLNIYDQECRIIFENSKIVLTAGGMGIITSLVVTFVIGLVLSLIAVFAVNMIVKARDEIAQENLLKNQEADKEE